MAQAQPQRVRLKQREPDSFQRGLSLRIRCGWACATAAVRNLVIAGIQDVLKAKTLVCHHSLMVMAQQLISLLQEPSSKLDWLSPPQRRLLSL